jgi:hypothetical protein
MSDDDVSDVGAPLVNALEAHPSADEVVDEIIVTPYPGVSYGVPLDEISTAAEDSSVVVKTTDEVTDEGTLPSEPIQEIELSNANLSLEDIAASLLDNDIKLELSKDFRGSHFGCSGEYQEIRNVKDWACEPLL